MTGADAYEVRRDGAVIATVTATRYDDSGAGAPPPPPAPTGLTASQDLADRVGYELSIDDGVFTPIGDVTSHADTAAPAADLSPGTAAASQGTHLTAVTLALAGAGFAPASRRYAVRARSEIELLVDGGTIYAGGRSDTIAGATRNRLAAFTVATGDLTAWNPDANGSVETLALAGGRLYAGGTFSTLYAAGQFRTMGGRYREGVASFEP